jgi:hypothetical protein
LNFVKGFSKGRHVIGADTGQLGRVGLAIERINLKPIVSAYLKAR